MDATMSLFEADYSLFGGDLLFLPPADSSDEVLTASQDGLKTIPESGHVEWLKKENSQSQEVLSAEAVSGGLLQDWLDTPVDLLNLFTEENTFSTDATSFGVNLHLDDVKTDTPNLEALKSLTEDIALGLSTEAVAPQVGTTIGTDLSGQNTGDVYDTGLGLLELLTDAVNQDTTVSEITSLDLMPIDFSSPILSPVSPEDVETILSSGPASPVSCTTERSFQSIISPETSLIDFSTMENEACLSEDLMELTQMVQESESSSSESECLVKVNKSRPTPYDRKKKKVLQDSTPPEENGNILDRKLRKKQQNKDAATRYRQKKKAEQDIVNNELNALESRNTNLKNKVSQMTNEIQYLKNLLLDVQKARIKRVKSE